MGKQVTAVLNGEMGARERYRLTFKPKRGSILINGSPAFDYQEADNSIALPGMGAAELYVTYETADPGSPTA